MSTSARGYLVGGRASGRDGVRAGVGVGFRDRDRDRVRVRVGTRARARAGVRGTMRR